MKKAHPLRFIAFASPSQAALDAIVVLRLYSAGRIGAAPVRAALDRIESCYGLPVRGAVALYRHSLTVEGDAARAALRFAALTRITDWAFRHTIPAALWHCLAGLGRLIGPWPRKMSDSKGTDWDRYTRLQQAKIA